MKINKFNQHKLILKSLIVLFFLSVTYIKANAEEPTVVDYFVQKIDEIQVTRRALEDVRYYASIFAKLAKKENLKEVFEYDPIMNQYTIHVDKIKDPDLKQFDWSGSKYSGSSNIFGTYTSKKVKGEKESGKKKYAGMVAVWLYEYIKLYGYPTFE